MGDIKHEERIGLIANYFILQVLNLSYKALGSYLSSYRALGRSHPPASLSTSPGSAPTFFVVSPVITRTFSVFCGFTCGILCKFRRKHISCRFCQGFRFPGEVIPYDFRIRRKDVSAGNVKLFAGRK
ncbi:transmembrane protein, putative [Medicago truncatula]|uniref:Transmembrane protein, putative n=1 Tax=Medicago truncatula TaxID=3880 RepID=A0A072ULQ1_MEDTR|nr:transmembrane protein, putative [Medicago truncatula]